MKSRASITSKTGRRRGRIQYVWRARNDKYAILEKEYSELGRDIKTKEKICKGFGKVVKPKSIRNGM
jgi:hypothetical protein